MQGIISAVRRNSLAENAGIKAGEKLCAVNGVSVHDIIELSYLVADEQIVLTIEDSECRQRQIVIEKYTDEELGLEFEAAVFDGVTTCYNNCVFCFVDQMIPGMRESLYVRDDDYRLSFLYGNFITLTNMKEEDFEQIIKTHMSPLYISVHATRPEVRCQMMNNRFAGELMSKINRLVEAGISIHTQIVCCPGYNDGEVLEQTYRDLEALAPMVETMAVVPVGITKHREHLTPMRLFSKPAAAAIVDQVTVWQQECRKRFGKSFVYLGDEFYLLAEKQLPDASWYDGFPQIENGIGLSRSFIDEWQQIAAKTDVCNHSVDAVIPVGTSAYKILQPLLDNFNNKTGSKHSFIPVNNEFFGETINVTGLLVGKDILNAAQGMKRIILPAVVLNQDNLFLDDMSFDDFKKAFDGKVERAVNARELVMLLSR